jgi:hypothetical protein
MSLKKVFTNRKGWQKKVADLMKRKFAFTLVTEDPEFVPDARDLKNAGKWVIGDGPGIVGGGALVVVGGTMIILAFVDPEPTTTLMGMVAGGAILTIAGGTYMFSIALMRRKYSFRFSVNTGGRFEWKATPSGQGREI